MLKIAFGALLSVTFLTGSYAFYNNQYEPDYDKMMANVVRITAEGPDGQELGHGTGVILEDGKIASASHVFTAKGATYTAKTNHGDYFKLKIIKDIPEKDIIFVEPAVKIKLDGAGAKLYCAPVKVGTRVISMGSPTLLDWVSTFGRISTVRQSPQAIERPVIVITAPLGPGMSGGPTFNVDGEVVGLNDAILTAPTSTGSDINKISLSFLGLGLIVPAQDVCEELDKIKED